MENLSEKAEFKDGDLVYYLAGKTPVVASVINANKFIDHIDAGECIEIEYIIPEVMSNVYRVNILKSDIDKCLFKDRDLLFKAFVKKHEENLLKIGAMINNLRDL